MTFCEVINSCVYPRLNAVGMIVVDPVPGIRSYKNIANSFGHQSIALHGGMNTVGLHQA